MPIDYSFVFLGLAGIFSIITSIFVYTTKTKVENQNIALNDQSIAFKQIEVIADNLGQDITKSTMKLSNMKEIIDKRFSFIEEHKQMKINDRSELDQFSNLDILDLPDEIKNNPAKYFKVIEVLSKYEEIKKEKSKDVMFG